MNQTTQSYFQKSIIAKGLVPQGIDPRHIEGFILLQYGSHSHLDWPTIRREVKIGVACAREDLRLAESNAKSYGL